MDFLRPEIPAELLWRGCELMALAGDRRKISKRPLIAQLCMA